MKAIFYYVRRHTSMMSSGEIRLHGFCSDLEFQLGWPIRFPERNICVKFQSANGSMLADTERTIFSILLNKLQSLYKVCLCESSAMSYTKEKRLDDEKVETLKTFIF